MPGEAEPPRLINDLKFTCPIDSLLSRSKRPEKVERREYAKTVILRQMEATTEEIGGELLGGGEFIDSCIKESGVVALEREEATEITINIADCLVYRYMGMCATNECATSYKVSKVINSLRQGTLLDELAQ